MMIDNSENIIILLSVIAGFAVIAAVIASVAAYLWRKEAIHTLNDNCQLMAQIDHESWLKPADMPIEIPIKTLESVAAEHQIETAMKGKTNG